MAEDEEIEEAVAADASPLIGIASAGAFQLLEKLFGRVVVTAAVRDEVLAGEGLPGSEELRAALGDGWIRVVPDSPRSAEFPELGAGEASTLAFALERGGVLVLVDDALARARARELGIPVTGLAGLLLAARRAGLVRRVRPVLERLAAAGFRLSDELVRAILDEAGEG